jgi:hypothetical protein
MHLFNNPGDMFLLIFGIIKVVPMPAQDLEM